MWNTGTRDVFGDMCYAVLEESDDEIKTALLAPGLDWNSNNGSMLMAVFVEQRIVAPDKRSEDPASIIRLMVELKADVNARVAADADAVEGVANMAGYSALQGAVTTSTLDRKHWAPPAIVQLLLDLGAPHDVVLSLQLIMLSMLQVATLRCAASMGVPMGAHAFTWPWTEATMRSSTCCCSMVQLPMSMLCAKLEKRR